MPSLFLLVIASGYDKPDEKHEYSSEMLRQQASFIYIVVSTGALFANV
jgi:hypothetical protein